jgi:dTDP-4-amino-4,6-dideoxygalactose transaminase
MILCANPRAQYLAHKHEIDAAIAAVLERGFYVLGEEVRAFEREFAAYVGVNHAIGVGSGTEALHIALAALGIGPGDEVITVAHTAVATVSAIEMCGATPVFVDIDPQTYSLDPTKLAARITSRTRAVVPVHLYGRALDLDPIFELANKHGLAVIEDCAQAHGARRGGVRAGARGSFGCFSFYPTKNLGCIGDGGMIVTNDAELATRARRAREYGWADRYVSQTRGWNSRLDEIQAAVLRVKLRTLDADNAARCERASQYDAALRGTHLELPAWNADGSHVFHLYVVRSRERDRLQSALKEAGIGALVHYPVPIHLQPAYVGRFAGSEALPETERAAREVLSLPMYPELSPAEASTVAAQIHSFERNS